MKYLLTTVVVALGLSGCAALTPPQPGQTEAEVLSRMGKPTATYQDGNTRLLEYHPSRMGQYAYMARIGSDGRLMAFTQVWTIENFQKIVPNKTTQEDVLKLVGQPTEIVQYRNLPEYAAWNYGFRESGAWDSMMTVYIDKDGIVRRLENGPDLRFDVNVVER